MRASAVRVVVDEQSVGVQAAARYQLANMGRKQAQLWREEAALADSWRPIRCGDWPRRPCRCRQIGLPRCAMRKALNCARPRRIWWWSAF